MVRITYSFLVAWLVIATLSPVQAQDNQDKKNNVVASAKTTKTTPTGDYCIPADTPQIVSQCPSNAPKAAKKSGKAPESRLHEAKRKSAEKKGKGAAGPSIQIDAATMRRQASVQVRAKQLLERETTITKRLIANTRTNDPKRPDFLLRLAELYYEHITQQNAAVRKLDEPIYAACSKKKDANQCRLLRAKQSNEEKELNKLRADNIQTLAILVRDHSEFRRMDEVLFSLGFALEELKQYDKARLVYHRLIKEYPASKYIPNAYLSFAEYYFQQGDMQAALKFYKKVNEIPPDRNNVYGYSLYKQAWCFYNVEDFKGSLQAFVETIEFGTQNPKAQGIENLIKQSRREMIMPYAQIGNPEQALKFFSRYAKNEAEALTMVENLGELYYDTGNWVSAIAIYHRLMGEKPDDDKVCYWQTRVSNAVISSKPKPEQLVEIQRMTDLYEKYQQAKHSEEARGACKQATASVMIDLATAWHREAIGTDTQPGTNDRNTMSLSAKLYRLVLDKFPDMEKMEFPEIDKRDWPTTYNVSYYYAELLWKMENWNECGPAFDKVVELNPQGQYTSDAAYAAVLCYNKSYQLTFQSSETKVRGKGMAEKEKKKGKGKGKEDKEDEVAKYKSRDFSPLESGMLNAFQRYICFVPDSEDLPQIKYRRARIYYESNHFEEASVLFKDITFNHPTSDLAVYAANLYLDSLNVIGSFREPKRPTCYDEMNDSIEPLHGIYCKDEQLKATNEDLCKVVEQLRCDLLRKKAETLQANKEWKKSAEVYVSIYRKYSECGRLDEVLYNAAINFEAARLLGRAIKVRNVLIDKHKDSEWAKRAVYLIGANFHALALYEQAANYYEQFADKYPGEEGKDCRPEDKAAGSCAIAHEALQNATFFRLGLGDEQKAVADAKLFQKNYERKLPRETSQVFYSLGSIYERQKDWKKVIEHYNGFIRDYKKSALPSHLIEANVIVGRAYLSLNDKKKASPYFDAAVKLWEQNSAKFATLDIPEDQKQRNLAKAKIATAEALFHQADELFDKFKGIAFPTFKGTVSAKDSRARKLKMKESFEKWMKDEFVKWMDQKAKALAEAEKSYGRIAELKVPEWDIAAASRIGEMYRVFVDDFRSAPVPPVLVGDDELIDAYYGGLDDASKPWIEKAKSAYEFCLITATKVRWFNEYMSQCEQELFKLDPRQYPRAAEVRTKISYTYSKAAEPGAVDLTGAEDLALEEDKK
jgi:tetratricopeptide (TPR) repeat protein